MPLIPLRNNVSSEYLLRGLHLPVSKRLEAVQVPLERPNRAVARDGVVGRNGVDAGLSGGSLRGGSQASRGASSATSSGGGSGHRGRVRPVNALGKGDVGKAAPDEAGQAKEQDREEVHDDHYGRLTD